MTIFVCSNEELLLAGYVIDCYPKEAIQEAILAACEIIRSYGHKPEEIVEYRLWAGGPMQQFHDQPVKWFAVQTGQTTPQVQEACTKASRAMRRIFLKWEARELDEANTPRS